MRDVGTLLSGFLERISQDEELSYIFLSELWPQLVGEQVARHARPESLRQGRLTLNASSRSWQRELAPLADGIARAVNRRWNAKLVERIEIKFHPMD